MTTNNEIHLNFFFRNFDYLDIFIIGNEKWASQKENSQQREDFSK